MSAYRIQKYVLREIMVPMLLALVVFTFVLMMGRSQKLMEMVIDKGIPAGEMLHLFLDLMPAFLVLTIPVAFLLGVLLGFGRLSSESELTALKACGVSLPVLLKPVLGLALGASLLIGYLTLYVEPAANAAFRRQALQIAANRATTGIKPMTFNDNFEGLVLYVSDIDDKNGKLQRVFIADERPDSVPATIFATSGDLHFSPEDRTLLLRLENGSIHRRPASESNRPADEEVYQTIGFATYALRINLDRTENGGRATATRKEKELRFGELLSARRNAATGKEFRNLDAALHKRFVLATTPLIFALVGVPLGIRSHRSGRGIGFTLALAIFLAFYILFSLAKTLVVQGGIPALAMWLPTLVFLAAGGYLVRQVSREKEVSFSFASLFGRRS